MLTSNKSAVSSVCVCVCVCNHFRLNGPPMTWELWKRIISAFLFYVFIYCIFLVSMRARQSTVVISPCWPCRPLQLVCVCICRCVSSFSKRVEGTRRVRRRLHNISTCATDWKWLLLYKKEVGGRKPPPVKLIEDLYMMM
jgi:hypothetical protein